MSIPPSQGEMSVAEQHLIVHQRHQQELTIKSLFQLDLKTNNRILTMKIIFFIGAR